MKKRIWILALVCLLVCLPALSLAADGNTLRVSGSATVMVAPDEAVLNIGYSAENPDPAAAQKLAADVINAMIEAAKAQGIEAVDIKTQYLNFYPAYDYTESGQTLRGYHVEHMLAITVRDIEQIGTVMDALLAAGANESGGISYQSSRADTVYLEALAKAIEHAAAKADAMAIAAGVWLGALEQVNEISNSQAFARTEAMYDMAAGVALSKSMLGDTLMTGDLEISASVELVYGIR
ncbi:MAG: SIMPL domain-containing protein [Oscillospiraceae bacterium]|nr:SIMPL domain-containing protein [Oscillospiraceae bacterium]